MHSVLSQCAQLSITLLLFHVAFIILSEVGIVVCCMWRRECTCPVSCVTTVLRYSSEVSIVVIVVSVIVSAIGIAGLAAGIATVSCCVYMMWRKKTTASVGGTQDHGESLLVLIK